MEQKTYWKIMEWRSLRLVEISEYPEIFIDGDAYLVYVKAPYVKKRWLE